MLPLFNIFFLNFNFAEIFVTYCSLIFTNVVEARSIFKILLLPYFQYDQVNFAMLKNKYPGICLIRRPVHSPTLLQPFDFPPKKRLHFPKFLIPLKLFNLRTSGASRVENGRDGCAQEEFHSIPLSLLPTNKIWPEITSITAQNSHKYAKIILHLANSTR